MDLGLIWLAIIAFALLLYVILDGFALVMGLLFPLLDDHKKDIVTSILLPNMGWQSNMASFCASMFLWNVSDSFYIHFPKDLSLGNTIIIKRNML